MTILEYLGHFWKRVHPPGQDTMGCFGCANEVGATDDDPNLIIDVEKVLAEAAWRMFKIAHGK